MTTPFLILSLPRSGSYHLVSLLDSAPDLVCLGELYKTERVEAPPPVLRLLGLKRGDVAGRDAMGATALQRIEAAFPGCAVGFKAFPSHLRALPHRRELLFGPGRRRILLRRDPVERFLSLLRVRAHGRWTRLTGEPPPPMPELTWRRDEFEAHLNVHRSWEKLADRVREADRTALSLDYRDLKDPGALARLLRFLGSAAAPEDLRSDRLRQHCGPPERGVRNLAEMRADLEAMGLKAPVSA